MHRFTTTSPPPKRKITTNFLESLHITAHTKVRNNSNKSSNDHYLTKEFNHTPLIYKPGASLYCKCIASQQRLLQNEKTSCRHTILRTHDSSLQLASKLSNNETVYGPQTDERAITTPPIVHIASQVSSSKNKDSLCRSALRHTRQLTRCSTTYAMKIMGR